MPTTSGHSTAIRAKKVIGTAVHDDTGDKIGVIEDLVLDKQSNAILFAVIGQGGVLGVGEKFHPIPWSVLDYDPDENAYVIPFTKQDFQTAPADTLEELTRDDGLPYRDKVYAYYQAEQYWT